MELTQAEAELAEDIKKKPDAWVLKYKRYHYAAARMALGRAGRHPQQREDEIKSARIERGLARVARREIQRRRDDIERDHL